MKRLYSRRALSILGFGLSFGLSVALGCSSPAPVKDGGGSTGGADSGPLDAGTAGAAARIRLANLAPLGAPFDLCTAVHGSGQFQGPLLASLGLGAGVQYADVSAYVPMPAGTLDFRLVPVDAGCSQALEGTRDLTDLPPFADGAELTGAEVAGSSKSFQIFQDDLLAPDSQTAGLRFINASADTPSLDLGIRQDGGFTPWITGAQFLSVGGTAQMYSLDANGYLAVPENANVLLEVESQSKDLLDLSLPSGEGQDVSGGALYTLFALTGTPLSGLLCADQSLLSTSYTACALYPLP